MKQTVRNVRFFLRHGNEAVASAVFYMVACASILLLILLALTIKDYTYRMSTLSITLISTIAFYFGILKSHEETVLQKWKILSKWRAHKYHCALIIAGDLIYETLYEWISCTKRECPEHGLVFERRKLIYDHVTITITVSSEGSIFVKIAPTKKDSRILPVIKAIVEALTLDPTIEKIAVK